MKRFFALIFVLTGALSLLSSLWIGQARREDAPALEWLYYLTLMGHNKLSLHRSQLDANLTQNLLRKVPDPNALYVNASPDLNWFYFAVDTGGFVDIYRMSRSGDHWQNLTQTPDIQELPVGWAGEWLLFNRYHAQGHDLYRMRGDGSELERLTTNFSGQKRLRSWSTDGAWIFWEEFGETGQRTGIMGKHITAPTSQNFAANVPDANFIGLSSDNRAVYLLGLREGGSIGIYRVALNTGERLPIDPSSTQYQNFLTDSPDAEWLYYTQANDAQQSVLMAYSVAEQTSYPILTRRSISGPFFSPDGEWMVVTSADTSSSDFRVHLMRPDGSEARILAQDQLSFLSWSDDSRFIFARGDLFYRIDLNGEQRALSSIPDNAIILRWTSDKWLLYQTLADVWYRVNIYTGQSSVIQFPAQVFNFIGWEDIETQAKPYASLLVGGGMLLLGLMVGLSLYNKGTRINRL